MDAREFSSIVSSESPGMLATPNSYGNGAGVTYHSLMMANSFGMRIPVTSMISSFPTAFEASGAYNGDDGHGMTQDNMLNLVEPLKKRRGRPRKYGTDGSMSLTLYNSAESDRPKSLSSSEPTAKKRGRPRGSRNKQLDALGSSGTSFIPHIIIVKPSEDVVSKIMAFSQQGPRTVCILSANGTVSNITLRQTASSGGSATYEDQFEIISLSGSFSLKDTEGTRCRTGGLSATLVGSNGRVIAGEVGRLIAASPVQVVAGSFILSEKKSKRGPSMSDPLRLDLSKPEMAKSDEPSSASDQMQGLRAHSETSPPSRESASESDDERRRSLANNHRNPGGVCEEFQ